MTITQLLIMLAGASLVAFGVVAGAVADRIRGRYRAEPRYRASKNAGAHAVQTAQPTGADLASSRMAEDVTRALVTAGYDKATAQIAALACAGSERATLEAWTRAALRRAMNPSPDARSARGSKP